MKVYEMLKQGKSEDEIVDYMVARYGNFVTYNPPLTASTLILWVGPALFVVVGFTILVMRSRKPKTKAEKRALNSEEQARLDALLEEQNEQDNKEIKG